MHDIEVAFGYIGGILQKCWPYRHIQQACPDLSIGCWFNTKHRPGGRRRHRVKPESKTASDVQEISPTVFVDCRSDVADQEFKVGPDLHIVMKTDGAQIIMSIIRRTNGHTNKAGAPGAGIKTMIQSSDEDRFIRQTATNRTWNILRDIGPGQLHG